MATILNKTTRPLRVPLPGNKLLRLAPRKSAEVAAKAVSHEPLQKMVESGEIEVTEDGRGRSESVSETKGLSAAKGHTSDTTIRRTGNR